MGAYGSPEHNFTDPKNDSSEYRVPDFKMEPKICKRCGCQYVGYFCPACGRRGKLSIKVFFSSFTLGMIVGGLVFAMSFIIGSGLHK